MTGESDIQMRLDSTVSQIELFVVVTTAEEMEGKQKSLS